jgi:hypothetical protein
VLTFRRTPVVDEYVEDDRCAVLAGDRVLVLSEVATTVLQVVGEAGEASLEVVVDALVDRFGLPPGDEDPAEACLGVTNVLVGQGLIESIRTEDPSRDASSLGLT